MEFRRILEKVKEQFSVLSDEFKGRKMRWVIYDQVLIDDKLKIVIKMNKSGSITTENFFIWPRNAECYFLQKEGSIEPQVVLKEQLVKTMAIEMNGGPVIGTSLIDEDWSRKHFKHLNRIAAT